MVRNPEVEKQMPRFFGMVARQQRVADLKDRARRGGVEGRLGRFYLSQATGGKVKPL